MLDDGHACRAPFGMLGMAAWAASWAWQHPGHARALGMAQHGQGMTSRKHGPPPGTYHPEPARFPGTGFRVVGGEGALGPSWFPGGWRGGEVARWRGSVHVRPRATISPSWSSAVFNQYGTRGLVQPLARERHLGGTWLRACSREDTWDVLLTSQDSVCMSPCGDSVCLVTRGDEGAAW